MNKSDWSDFVDRSEQRTLTLTLEERNLISDAAAHIDWLESRKQFSELQVKELRQVLQGVRDIFVTRAQPGWEKRLLDMVSAVLKATEAK